MTSVFFTYPLEIIRIRMAYATHSAHSPPRAHAQLSFLSAMRQIYHEGPTALASPSSAPTTSPVFTRLPILKFYRGFTVTLIGMIPYAGTSFLAWGLLRSHFLPAPAPSPSGSSPAPRPKSHPSPTSRSARSRERSPRRPRTRLTSCGDECRSAG